MTRQQEINAQRNVMGQRPAHTPVAGWQNQLASLVEQKMRNPIAPPVAPGTPTQRRIEADQAQQRWQLGFEADERHRAEQLRLQRRADGRRSIEQISAPPKPTLQDIIQGVVVAVDEGMKGVADPARNYDEHGMRIGVQPSQRTAQDVVDDIARALNRHGLEEDEYNEAMLAAYRAAGITPPGEQEPPEAALENFIAQTRLDYMMAGNFEGLAAFDARLRGEVPEEEGTTPEVRRYGR